MRIFAEVLPRWVGKVMYRINYEMRRYAPSWAEFVADPTTCDLQILDVIGTGSLEYLYNPKNYVLLQHCYLTAERQDTEFWVPLFRNAKMVTTYMDLQALTKSTDFNMHRMPWGVDTKIFRQLHHEKKADIMSTGHVADTECIDSAYKACLATGGRLYHVGTNFKWDTPTYYNTDNITDIEMAGLYSRSRYTIGLRRGEGFELPILEGLACYSRGIALDTPQYRYWYDDLVEYVPEGTNDEVTDALTTLLRGPYREVTDAEVQRVKDKFSWDKLFTNFWEHLERSL